MQLIVIATFSNSDSVTPVIGGIVDAEIFRYSGINRHRSVRINNQRYINDRILIIGGSVEYCLCRDKSIEVQSNVALRNT